MYEYVRWLSSELSYSPFYRATLCYASAVSAVVVCPSVRLSQTGVVSKRLDESSWVPAWRLSSTYPALCSKEIRVTPKIRVLPFGTFPQTPDLKNSPRQVDRVVNKTRQLSSLLTTPIRQSMSRGCLLHVENPLFHYLDLFCICCTNIVSIVVQQLTRSWLA